jgi:hypothetical protein
MRGTVGKIETGNPIRGGAACLECAFEVTIETFYYAVGLRMEYIRDVDGEDAEESEKVVPEGGNELGARSEVIVCGRPKQEIQVEQGASCKEVTEVNERVQPQPSMWCGQ